MAGVAQVPWRPQFIAGDFPSVGRGENKKRRTFGGTNCHDRLAAGVKPECEPQEDGEAPDVRLELRRVRAPEGVAAFEELFQMSYRRLARLLFRITRDFARAEEMASEAFWRLYRSPPKRDINLEGWLYRTGLRLALDHLRNERRRARYEALASPFGGTPGPDESLEQSEERERVRGVLGKLKREQAGLILLRAEGFGYAEIGAVLKLKTTSVGKLLARAEEAFRKEYIQRYGEPRS